MFTSNTIHSQYADGLISIGERLDRTYGLDLYDVEARQYDAIAPWFTSIDPLAEDFTWLTPYNYCGGDPINRTDPTGMEWGTRQNENGTTTIYVDVQLIVDGDGITADMVEAYKQAICSEFNRMISEASGGAYLGEVTFNGNVVDGQVTPTLTISQYGDPKISGMTTDANSIVGIYNNELQALNPIQFASTAIHELLHTARLDHPFDKTQTLDTQLFKTGGNEYVSTPLTDPNILYNVMNYPFTSIDGKTYYSMSTSKPQTSITKGQLNYLLKEIKLQQAGAGVLGDRDSYWNKDDYPGAPVWRIR